MLSCLCSAHAHPASCPPSCPCPPSLIVLSHFCCRSSFGSFTGGSQEKKQKMGYRRYGLYLSRRRHESRIICFCCAPYGTMKPFFVPISVTMSAPCGPQTRPRRLHVSIAQPLRRLPVFRTRSTHVQGLANPSFKRSRVGGIFDMGDR